MVKSAAVEKEEVSKIEPKSQPLVIEIEGAQFRINPSVVSEARAAMDSQHAVSQRWVKAQPNISAAFGAPLCYEAGTAHRQALLRFLEEVHPHFHAMEAAFAKIEIARRASDETKAMEARSAHAVYRDKVDVDVRNAYRALKRYFDAGRDASPSKRESKTVQDRLEQAAQMFQRFTGDNTPQVELAKAVLMVRVARALMTADAANVIRKLTDALPLELPSIPQTAGKIDKKHQQSSEVKVTKGEPVTA